MKKIFLFIPAVLFAFVLIAQPPSVKADKGAIFGQKLNEKKAVPADVLAKTLTEPGMSKDLIVSGKVTEVCTMQGCWIKMQTNEGAMMVKMKDHAFLVPLALNGKTVAVQGTAVFTETPVETLRHYAEDAGKSEEEIAKITAPKKEIVFTATGLKVLD
jgi:hypothetical protein